ncbi:MAG: hypothetical protein ACLGQU_09355 [Acidobacteriota bacterium]
MPETFAVSNHHAGQNLASRYPSMNSTAVLAAVLQTAARSRLISLRLPDVLIIVLHFAAVLGIGFYLKRFGAL